MSDKQRVEKIIKQWEVPRNRKEQFHPLWEDLSRIFLPRRMGFTSIENEGSRRTEDLYDSVPMQGARGLANNVGFFLRPQNQEWIRMRAEDDRINSSDEGKFWIADAQERLIGALRNPKARFRQATGEIDTDLVVFGTGIGFIGENQNMNSLLFQSIHLRDSTVLYSDEGVPEGMFRLRRMPIRNVASIFGENNLSENSRKKFNGKEKEERIKLLHVVLQRKEKKSGNPLLSINLPYMDLWIELDEKHILAEGGFHEFPFIAPGWDTTSGEDYGRSPAMIALPDGETLQAMEETILVSGQRAADPPLMAPNDGTFSAINTFPGGISYYDVETAQSVGGNPFFPLQSGVNLPITRDMQRDKRDQVFGAFFRNILNLPTEGPQMTATEVLQRKDEFIRELGPVFGRLETDYTAPMVERSFNIMLRAGAFLPIPEVLQGQNITFEYESPLAKIRQQVKAAEATLWAREMIELSSVDPDVLDVVNFDNLARFKADSSAVPFGIVNTKSDVDALRKAKAEQIRQQQQADQMEQGAGIAEKFAKAADKAGFTQQ